MEYYEKVNMIISILKERASDTPYIKPQYWKTCTSEDNEHIINTFIRGEFYIYNEDPNDIHISLELLDLAEEGARDYFNFFFKIPASISKIMSDDYKEEFTNYIEYTSINLGNIIFSKRMTIIKNTVAFDYTRAVYSKYCTYKHLFETNFCAFCKVVVNESIENDRWRWAAQKHMIEMMADNPKMGDKKIEFLRYISRKHGNHLDEEARAYIKWNTAPQKVTFKDYLGSIGDEE